MIFAQGFTYWDYVLMFAAAALAVPAAIASPLVGAIVLQRACSLFDKIAPGKYGTDPMPRPRFGKALGIMALAVAVYWLVIPLVGRPLLLGLVIGLLPFLGVLPAYFLLGFIAMCVVAARMLGVPLWKSAAVMLVPSVITYGLSLPLGAGVLLSLHW